MPDATDVKTAADLWRTLPAGSLARRYVSLLGKAAKHGVTVGALPETVEATALSDWEAAAMIEETDTEDVTLGRIAGVREKLNRASPLVVKDGHRAGSTTYRLHPNLLTDPK